MPRFTNRLAIIMDDLGRLLSWTPVHAPFGKDAKWLISTDRIMMSLHEAVSFVGHDPQPAGKLICRNFVKQPRRNGLIGRDSKLICRWPWRLLRYDARLGNCTFPGHTFFFCVVFLNCKSAMQKWLNLCLPWSHRVVGMMRIPKWPSCVGVFF